jgi:hypothetical protein
MTFVEKILEQVKIPAGYRLCNTVVRKPESGNIREIPMRHWEQENVSPLEVAVVKIR